MKNKSANKSKIAAWIIKISVILSKKEQIDAVIQVKEVKYIYCNANNFRISTAFAAKIDNFSPMCFM
jgi:hypothetical protein